MDERSGTPPARHRGGGRRPGGSGGEEPHAPRSGWLQLLGPGFVTGASDDDPSGIGTYSQVGARFGYGMLWTMLFSYPLTASIQEICGRLGRVTGRGIAGNMRLHYPRWVSFAVVGPMVVANTINVGADLAAMSAALGLLIGGPRMAYSVAFALLSLLLELLLPYTRYSRYLKWLTLALFAYVGTIFTVRIGWGAAIEGTILPRIHLTAHYLTPLIAVLGTTISPYLFFWQTSEEAEEVRDSSGQRPLREAPKQAPRALHRIVLDTVVGMFFSNLVGYSIILTCAVTLNARGATNIDSAAQAAEALRPVAGPFAFLLFTAGIVGTGMLAIPVLAGSAAYAVGETFRWPASLESPPSRATRFYGVIGASTLVGLAINFLPINPIAALFWTAVINGVVAVPVMVVLMLMARNRSVMGTFVIPTRLFVGGWIATLVMIGAAIGMFLTWGQQ